jgi:hypothetical protein
MEPPRGTAAHLDQLAHGSDNQHAMLDTAIITSHQASAGEKPA